jgi:hypothetical protein
MPSVLKAYISHLIVKNLSIRNIFTISCVHVILIMVLALVSNTEAVYWSSSVDTNSSHWSIYRESSNISFDLLSSVEGKISPVESHGRILSPYQSYYGEIRANDVRLRQRTNALEGSYKSTDEIMMQSVVYPDEIEITVDKPIGTDIYAIEYENEQWPVFIKAGRTLALSKEQRSVIWLQRMNATVLATDDSILLAEFKPTKYLGYLINAKTTGIADLSYRLRDSQYDVKHQNYPALSEGEERYYGAFDLSRKIEMRSVFEKSNDTDDEAESWLPCCNGGWNDMMYFDKKGLGTDAKEVFDCTCYRETTKA